MLPWVDDYLGSTWGVFELAWAAREVFVSVWVHMSTALGAAATAALESALKREHGGMKLHADSVAALVAYFAGRGEAVTDLPLD